MFRRRVHVCAKRRLARDAADSGLVHRTRADHNVMRAHSIHVITGSAARISGIVVFLDPELFSVFGLPPTR
jgi:hypothetical protein